MSFTEGQNISYFSSQELFLLTCFPDYLDYLGFKNFIHNDGVGDLNLMDIELPYLNFASSEL